MNYYERLGCTQYSSLDEIKVNYYKLIKKHHPDKAERSVDNVNRSQIFIELDQAWKTLRNENTRKEYDAKLFQNQLNSDCVIHSTISKFDLLFDGAGFAVYPCRCGEKYIISKEDIDHSDKFIIEIPCSECSNSIQIK